MTIVFVGQTYQLVLSNNKQEEFYKQSTNLSLKKSWNICSNKKGLIIKSLGMEQVEIQLLLALNTLHNTDCARKKFPKSRRGKRSTQEDQLSSHFIIKHKNGTILLSSSGTTQKVPSTKIHSASLKAKILFKVKLVVDMQYFSLAMTLTL